MDGTTTTFSQPRMVHSGRVGEMHGGNSARKRKESSLQPKCCSSATDSCLPVLLGAVSLPGVGWGVSHTLLVLAPACFLT